MTGRIFISYRRGDSQAAAGRLYDRLLQHFDRSQLFMDVEAIEPGVDFVKSLDEQVSSCSAFVSVIGPHWLAAQNSDGSPRLDNPNDYVRVEIESALKRDIRVIPVLVDGASMPRRSDLPPSLEPLARRNAVEIAHHRFAADCDDLAHAIKHALGIATAPASPAQPLVSPPSPPDQATRNPGWAEVVFSFRGRISRKQFLIGLICVLVCALALLGAISLMVDGIFGGGDDQTKDVAKKLAIFDKRLTMIIEVGIWWPTWALTLKRLHDLEQGWKTLLLFVALGIAADVADLLEKDDLSWQLNLFDLGITFMLAAIKGTPGPNRYGPDPLAKLSSVTKKTDTT